MATNTNFKPDIIRNVQIESEAARMLVEHLNTIGADDEETKADMIEGETSLYEAVSAGVDYIGERETYAEALKAREAALRARRQRYENQAELARAAIANAIEIAELKKLELPQATISLRATAPTVQIVDETQIPDSYWKRADPTIDKRALLADLKAEKEIPGAVLSNGGTAVSIRFA
jgi:hypothetical protein